MCRSFSIVPCLLVFLFMLAGTAPLPAQTEIDERSDLITVDAETLDAIRLILASPGALELPIERIRPALLPHYSQADAQAYWLNNTHMAEFIARLEAADIDGLDPADYPVETFKALAAGQDSADARAQAHVELYFMAFLAAYASDLQTGRVVPKKNRLEAGARHQGS